MRALVWLFTVLLLALPAAAQDKKDVDLALALGIDISGSIDPDEAKLQREGYVMAFRDPVIVKAILGGANGRIACYRRIARARAQHGGASQRQGKEGFLHRLFSRSKWNSGTCARCRPSAGDGACYKRENDGNGYSFRPRDDGSRPDDIADVNS